MNRSFENNALQIGLKMGGVLSGLLKDTRITKINLIAELHAEGLEPSNNTSKAAVITSGMKSASDDQARRLTVRLVELLEIEGLFSSEEKQAEVDRDRLAEAISRVGGSLNDHGAINWHSDRDNSVVASGPQASSFTTGSTFVTPTSASKPDRSVGNLSATHQASLPRQSDRHRSHSSGGETTASKSSAHADSPAVHIRQASVSQIVEILKRIPFASHSLTKKRRQGHPVLKISDEYDAQDFVYSILRMFFDNVRDEETTPQTGGKGAYKGDFYLENENIMIELKVAKGNHGVREIKDEIAADQAHVRGFSWVKDLIVVVYDLEGVIADKRALAEHLNGDLKTTAVVTDWR